MTAAQTSRVEQVTDIVVGGALIALAVREQARGRFALAALGPGIAAQAFFPAVEQRAERSVTIAAPPDEVYRFCRDATHLGRAVPGLLDVRAGQDGDIAWRTRSPLGRAHTWPIVITGEQSPRLLAWRVRDHERPRGRFELRPAPGDRGTELHAVVHYVSRAPAALGATLRTATVDARLRETLRRLKTLIEARELPTTEGQPTGRRWRAAS
jgi:uncharacterized membrane protein